MPTGGSWYLPIARATRPSRFVTRSRCDTCDPNGCSWDATVTSIAADRAGVTVVNADLTSPFTAFVARDFLGRPQPPPPTRVTVTPQPPDEILTQLLQLAGPTLLETLATLMSSPDAASLIRTRFSSLQDKPDRMLDGRPAWVVVMQPRVQAAPVAIWIDPATKLVRRVEMILPRDPTARDDDLGDATLSWSSGSVVTDPDKVMAELEAATRDRLAQTVERSAPVRAAESAGAFEEPAAGTIKDPAHTFASTACANSAAKAVPVSVVPNSRDDRDGGLPVIAVSLLIVQPSGQTACAELRDEPRLALPNLLLPPLSPGLRQPDAGPVILRAPGRSESRRSTRRGYRRRANGRDRRLVALSPGRLAVDRGGRPTSLIEV